MAEQTTTITKTIMKGDRDTSFAARLKQAIPNVYSLPIDGYVEALRDMNEPDMRLAVFRRAESGRLGKEGEFSLGDLEPDQAETSIVTAWGPGTYQLRPVYQRQYYQPASIEYTIGRPADMKPAPPSIDDSAERERYLKRLRVQREIEQLEGGHGGDMKPEAMLAMLQAMMAPMTAAMSTARESANAEVAAMRAELAAERKEKHELLMRMLEAKEKPAAKSVTAELVDPLETIEKARLAAKALGLGRTGDDAGPVPLWSAEGFSTALQAAIPILQPVIQGIMEARARQPITIHPGPPQAMPSQSPRPPEAPNGGDMPRIPPEQQAAIEQAQRLFAEMMAAFHSELAKPMEDRNIPGLATWLQSVLVGADVSLYDRLVPIARSPEHLAALSLRADPGLAVLLQPQYAEGLKELFEHIRVEEESA